jgi:hypothetical protein
VPCRGRRDGISPGVLGTKKGHTGIYGGTDRLAGASGTEILLWAPREETHTDEALCEPSDAA